MLKTKKLISEVLLGLTLFTVVSDFNVNADSIENVQKVNSDNELGHERQLMILGKKAYKKYRAETLKYNNITYGNSNILATARKIPFTFSNKKNNMKKDIGKMLKVFPRKELIPRNFATSEQSINETPWITTSNNDPILQNIYNGRNVYYHINATGNLYNLYQTAIDAWNSLGVIQLIPTNDDNDSVIQLDPSQSNLGDGKIQGVTNYNIDNSNHFQNVHITVDDSIVNTTDDFNAISVVEHEIGHALGFAHNNKLLNDGNGYNVGALMNGQADDAAAGIDTVADFRTNNLVGANEQHKLMQMYGLSILPGYYRYVVLPN